MREEPSARPVPPPAEIDPSTGVAEYEGWWPAHLTRRQMVRWALARALAVLGSLGLMAGVAFGLSAWYTSRPQFCRSCHIMEPYYVSWQHSSHNGVSCIKCHFPPGVGEKVRGKMAGLVQLAKYATDTAGPRPAAEISDASCLRSGCHETRLLSGRLEFNGVPFDHGPHLENALRGKQLRCTSCHSQIVQGSHMTVTTSTCFLCHFKDGHLNEGLGACTRCHQIPQQQFDLKGGTKFDHNVVYERGMDCASCHADLVRGNGEVPIERCGVCHNRESDLKHIDDHVFIHQTHVTDHHVECLACHLTIHHKLDEAQLPNAAADCTACHPAHHHEQLQMLAGTGARGVHSRVSRMTEARITCASCHRVQEVSTTGGVLWKASMDTCLVCHDADVADRLTGHQDRMRDSLAQIEAAIQQVRAAVGSSGLPADRVDAISRQMDDLQYDLSFLRVSNGVHNIHYADAITRSLVEQLKSLDQELVNVDLQLELPEPLNPVE